jgi:hypothetical protein
VAESVEKKLTVMIPMETYVRAVSKMSPLGLKFQGLFLQLLQGWVESIEAGGEASSNSKLERGPNVVGTAKEQKQVSEFLDFLRTGEKSDVHTVLSLIARLSAHRSEMGESLPERKLHSR